MGFTGEVMGRVEAAGSRGGGCWRAAPADEGTANANTTATIAIDVITIANTTTTTANATTTAAR